MKHINLKQIAFFFLIITNLVVIGYYFNRQHINSRNKQPSTDSATPVYHYILSHLAANSLFQELSNGQFLIPDLSLRSSDDIIIPLKSVISENLHLVFYINNQSCNVCIESELKRLKSYSDKHDLQSNILVFNRHANTRHQRIFEIEHGFRTLSIINESSLGIEAETTNTPFYFILMPNLQVLGTYIPDNTDFNHFYFEKYISVFNKKLNLAKKTDNS